MYQQQPFMLQAAYAATGGGAYTEEEKIFGLIKDLLNPSLREAALLELSKRRETFDDLAPVLWHSFGTGHIRHFWTF